MPHKTQPILHSRWHSSPLVVPSHFIQGTQFLRIPLSSYNGLLSRFKVCCVCVCVRVCVCVFVLCVVCVCVWCIQLRFFREYIMCPHVHLMTDPAMCISFHIHTYICIYCLMASIHAIVLPPPSTLAICSYKHTQTDSSLAYTHNWVCIPVTCT